ncbi:B3 domain-containing protein Os11g0197600 isoform X2 [Cajanus cajan]|uniref:B3 domain-containing protein Os11g0197600 isoform X2 n=1 Tax=Cajanus cajan TaxID=3821 RepID=UPI00098DA0E7|nr:B3 domain-containing protein Os11g0197600 isoform X2 [Cajanus cajan]
MRDPSFHPNPKCFALVQRNNPECWHMDFHHQHTPLFFIIINNTKLLKVPKEFLKHLNEDLSSDAILIGTSGGQWQVTILKKGNEIYMQNGWPQFLTDNSVVLDEFLLFRYLGDKCFHVQIFGKNGCERPCLTETRQEEAATPSLVRTEKSRQRKTSSGSFLHGSKSCQEDLAFSNKCSLSNGCKTKKTRQKQAATPSLVRTNKSKQRKTCASSFRPHESKSCQEDMPFNNKDTLSNGCFREIRQEQTATPCLERAEKCKQQKTFAGSLHLHESKSYEEDLVFSNKGLLSKNFSKPRNSIKFESSEACKLAETFTSGKPHWKHLLRKSNVENPCILHIATEFARMYIPEAVTEIILWNPEGKFWEVTVNSQSKRYTQLTTGWGRFVRDNKLMRGDTCIFELEEGNEVSVHIFRTRCAKY